MNSSHLGEKHRLEFVLGLYAFDDGQREQNPPDDRFFDITCACNDRISEKPLGKVGIRRTELRQEGPVGGCVRMFRRGG